MTQYVVRLAVADDRPEVLRLQEQFIAELADPLGVAEGSHEHSMAEIVHGAIARDPGIAWRVPGFDRP